MSEQSHEGLGTQFAAARLEKKLSVDDVAEQLKLPINYIHAIEEDNYAVLPAPVFVRGYLKQYAALVNLPEVEVIAQYHRQEPVKEHKLTPSDTIKQQVSLTDFPIKMITYLVAVLMIVLLIVWWFGQSDDSSEAVFDEVVEVIGDSDATVVPITPLLPVVSPVAVDEDATIDKAESDEQTLAADVVEQAPLINTTTDGVENSQPDSPQPMDSSVNEQPSVVKVAAEIVEQPANDIELEIATEPSEKTNSVDGDDSVNLTLNFSSDCWVEVRQKDGTGLFVDLGRKGYEAKLVGQAPVRVLLGNSSVATVSVNGKPIDFSPFTQKLIARFVVMPDGSLQSGR